MRGRTFVALVPPPDVCDLLAALPRQDELGLRWTRRDQWHVTLRFLGVVDLDEAARALAGLSCPSVDVELGPTVELLGTSIVMVPVSGVDDLARAVVAATVGVGEAPERRDFRGHLTLARSKVPAGRVGLIGYGVAAQFTAGEIHLVRSETRHDGPVYSVVSTVALR